MFGLIAGALGMGAKALFGGGGGKPKGEDPYSKGERFVGKTESLVPRIQAHGDQFKRSSFDLNQDVNRLSRYNPWQGMEAEIGAITKKMTPGFEDREQSIRESASSRGSFRGGQALLDETHNLTDFQDRVAMALAERGTQRSALDLQGRQATVGARAGLSDRYMDTLASEGDIYAGLDDYYNQQGNAAQQAKSQEKAGGMQFLGDIAGGLLSFF